MRPKLRQFGVDNQPIPIPAFETTDIVEPDQHYALSDEITGR